jgi:hypothetical protein
MDMPHYSSARPRPEACASVAGANRAVSLCQLWVAPAAGAEDAAQCAAASR